MKSNHSDSTRTALGQHSDKKACPSQAHTLGQLPIGSPSVVLMSVGLFVYVRSLMTWGNLSECFSEVVQ